MSDEGRPFTRASRNAGGRRADAAAARRQEPAARQPGLARKQARQPAASARETRASSRSGGSRGEPLAAEDSRIRGQLAAAQGAGDTTPSSQGLIWPVNGPVTSPFGYRGAGCMRGSTSRAVWNADSRRSGGSVVLAALGRGYGNYTCIDHGGGLATCYAPSPRSRWAWGRPVAQGQVIGLRREHRAQLRRPSSFRGSHQRDAGRPAGLPLGAPLTRIHSALSPFTCATRRRRGQSGTGQTAYGEVVCRRHRPPPPRAAGRFSTDLPGTGRVSFGRDFVFEREGTRRAHPARDLDPRLLRSRRRRRALVQVVRTGGNRAVPPQPFR